MSSKPGGEGVLTPLVGLSVAEDDSLASSNPTSSSFVDAAALGRGTDAATDANVFLTYDPAWCISLAATNALGVNGPVQAYARRGSGLIVYSGLDKDSAGDPASSPAAAQLNRVWLLELLQPFAPDGLPCDGLRLAPRNATQPTGGSHTLTAHVTSAGVNQAGVSVSFSITNGPNSPRTGMATTNASGDAAFSYTSNGTAGTDVFLASASLPGAGGGSVGVRDIASVVWATSATPTSTATPTATSTPVPPPSAVRLGWGWGNHNQGQLGTSATQLDYGVSAGAGTGPVPAPLSGLGTDVVGVAAAYSNSLAVKADGSVWSWGRFTTSAAVTSPVRMTGLSNMVAVAAGWNHSLALRSDGTVWAWGSNASGQLGTGSGTTHDAFGPDSSTPVQVPGLGGVVAIAAGHFNSMALASDGSVWAWGSNLSGELGQPGCVVGLCPFNEGVPNRVPRLGRATAIASGVGFSLAALADGTVWGWGMNNTGQLGNGTTIDTSTPVQVIGPTSVSRVSAGDNHGLAVTSGGAVWWVPEQLRADVPLSAARVHPRRAHRSAGANVRLRHRTAPAGV